MRTAEERIRRLHRRSRELERKYDSQRLSFYGCASVLLAIMLPVAMKQLNGLSGSVSHELLGGASLLSNSVGGYVLVAVLAFIIGVMVTVAIMRYRKKDVRANHKDDLPESEEDTGL